MDNLELSNLLGCDHKSLHDDTSELGCYPLMEECSNCSQQFYSECWYTRPASLESRKKITTDKILLQKKFDCKICRKLFETETEVIDGDHGIRRNFQRVNCNDLYVHTTRGGNRLVKQKVRQIRMQKVIIK